MAPAHPLETYKELLLFLCTAGLVAPVFRRLRISPVIGYIGAGVLLGPHGLGALADRWPILDYVSFSSVEQIAQFAEFGVVFLLFMIGLELSFERLKRMRKLVFGLGALQVLVTILVIATLGVVLGEKTGTSLVIGAALALSSTAIVMPILVETKRLATDAGRASFAILLFQDLMIAPLLFMVSVLGTRAESGFGVGLFYALAPAVIALALLVGIGRLVLRPLFHHVALSRSTEFFMAAALLVVLGTGMVTEASGLSMALGAFIAGLLLAETEYRRELEVTIEPFKGLLLGLFFVSVGAGLDLSHVIAAPYLTLGIAIAFVVIKAIIVYGLARLLGKSHAAAFETALLIGPGGEFAFVMIGAAAANNLLSSSAAGNVMLAVTLSMLAIPFLAPLSTRAPRKAPTIDPALLVPPSAEETRARVLIIGYGRVGRLVSDMLTRHNLEFLAVDGDAKLVAAARDAGVPIYWGDATRPDFLFAMGIAHARALVVTMDAPRAAELIVEEARKMRPDLTIVARARDATHATHLYQLGASDAIPETIEASLQLSEAVLVDIGIPMGYVIASIHEKRDEYRQLLQKASPSEKPRHAIRMSTRVKDMNKPKKSVEGEA
ncbi:monovalent cation:proton antiporter-2 (CPA2) family protein [Methylovirgula sp. 4M-Z18]|uniref:monovalent cation:proton antiporter-2 (CPA2) family protein n=1 Tax=Methylovirgula sp. 4M-Z18 TaxID=2293567 RepID=UPI000E2F756D|nr:monovalent cation:proton antiporter-2 (CPA2) family protein [Methylovirgula sp. 4M-Z18]RFB78132.1 potassium transporter TrkA [Methylovirgula sp. 4M-Z18]